jgi:hypothetical protein
MYSGTPINSQIVPPVIQVIQNQLSADQLQRILRGEVVTVTVFVDSATAAAWLKCNPDNRNLSPKTVEKYANYLRNNDWTFHHQGMAFASTNELIDGQHRLQAVVEANVALRTLVTFNLSKNSRESIDQLKARSPIDLLVLAGHKNVNFFVTGAISVMYGRGSMNAKLSAKELDWWYTQYGEGIQFAIRHLCNKAQRKGVAVGAVLAPCVRAYYCPEVDRIRLAEFMEVVSGGIVNGSEDHAATLLRTSLLTTSYGQQRGNSNRGTIYRKTERALEAFLARQELKNLREAGEELFWLPHEQLAQEGLKKANIVELHRQREAGKSEKAKKSRSPIANDDESDLLSQQG